MRTIFINEFNDTTQRVNITPTKHFTCCTLFIFLVAKTHYLLVSWMSKKTTQILSNSFV